MLDRTIAYGLDFVFPAGDTAIGHSLALSGEFARVIRDFLISQAKDDRGVLLDVGANIGAIGLPFAATKHGWQVVAIEAHRGLAGLLAANVANNRLGNVEVLHAAAGAERRVADFPNPSFFQQANYGTVNFGATNQQTAPVLMVTLDEVAPTTTRPIDRMPAWPRRPTCRTTAKPATPGSSRRPAAEATDFLKALEAVIAPKAPQLSCKRSQTFGRAEPDPRP